MPNDPQGEPRPSLRVVVTGLRYFVPEAVDQFPAHPDEDLVRCEVLPGVTVYEPVAVLEQLEADLARTLNRVREQRAQHAAQAR